MPGIPELESWGLSRRGTGVREALTRLGRNKQGCSVTGGRRSGRAHPKIGQIGCLLCKDWATCASDKILHPFQKHETKSGPGQRTPRRNKAAPLAYAIGRNSARHKTTQHVIALKSKRPPIHQEEHCWSVTFKLSPEQ